MFNADMFRSLSNETIAGYEIQYKDNKAILDVLSIVKQARAKEESEAKVAIEAEVAKQKAILDWNVKLGKIKLGNPPDGISNVYFRWSEVEADDPDETHMVEASVVGEDGKLTHKMERAKIKSIAWQVEINHTCNLSRGATTTTTASANATKRGITVLKVNGTQLEPQGNFRNGKEACDHLILEVGANSAMRVLQTNGYITQAYDGTAFTVAK